MTIEEMKETLEKVRRRLDLAVAEVGKVVENGDISEPYPSLGRNLPLESLVARYEQAASTLAEQLPNLAAFNEAVNQIAYRHELPRIDAAVVADRRLARKGWG